MTVNPVAEDAVIWYPKIGSPLVLTKLIASAGTALNAVPYVTLFELASASTSTSPACVSPSRAETVEERVLMFSCSVERAVEAAVDFASIEDDNVERADEAEVELLSTLVDRVSMLPCFTIIEDESDERADEAEVDFASIEDDNVERADEAEVEKLSTLVERSVISDVCPTWDQVLPLSVEILSLPLSFATMTPPPKRAVSVLN